MTDKTFAVAGVSKLNGKFRARFAKDLLRIKVLDKAGHTDIDLVELPEPMTKPVAAAHLIDINFDAGNEEIRAALYAEIDRADGVRRPAAAPEAAAEEAEEQAVITEVPEEVIERAHEIAAEMELPKERELSMTPAAIRKREARARAKQTSPAAEAFQEWAEKANAEEAEAGEAEDIQF